MSSLWNKVEAIVESGQAPRLTLAPSHEVKPVRRVVGRPRVRDNDNPFAHYATPRQGLARPLCLACKRRLRVNDVEVCQREECKLEAMRWLSSKLAALRGRASVPITATAAKHMLRSGLARAV